MSLPPLGPSAGPPPQQRVAGPDDGSLRSPLGRAAVLMVGYLVLLWVLDLINSAQHRELNTELGIEPRQPDRLPEIFTAPFLHGSVTHLAANAMPLFGLGLIAALTGVRRFIGVTAVIVLVSGLGVWLFGPSDTVTVGASGIVFGYFGYLVLRGLIDRRPVDIVVAAGVALAYGYLLPGVLPGQEGISWQGHLSGFLGGVLAAWLFRRRRAKPAAEPEPTILRPSTQPGPPTTQPGPPTKLSGPPIP